MHFICSPFGSAGDVHPFLGLALALRRRGHDVTFVVSEYFREAVERHGLEYVQLGTRDEFLQAINNPNLWNPIRAFHHVFKHLIEEAIRQQYAIFAERYRPGETLGLTNVFGMGALVAQETIGIPVATVNLQPGIIFSRERPPTVAGMFGPRWVRNMQLALGEKFFIDSAVCPALNRFRAEFGLPPVKRILSWWQSKRCVVCLFPDWYAAPASDWPANLIQTDFPLWDDEQDQQLPAEVEAFLAAGTPPIVFTPGSANLFGKDFFQAAADACVQLGQRGILLTRFAEQIPASLPADVAHFAYVPFTPLLPRAAAVVHHGGVGSTAQGLAAGIPQLLMPLAHDQFDNAAIVKRLRVGDWLPQSRFTASRASAKLGALLSDLAAARACRQTADRLKTRDGCDRTAAELERWAKANICSKATMASR